MQYLLCWWRSSETLVYRPVYCQLNDREAPSSEAQLRSALMSIPRKTDDGWECFLVGNNGSHCRKVAVHMVRKWFYNPTTVSLWPLLMLFSLGIMLTHSWMLKLSAGPQCCVWQLDSGLSHIYLTGSSSYLLMMLLQHRPGSAVVSHRDQYWGRSCVLCTCCPLDP